jgi:hypothetical protein
MKTSLRKSAPFCAFSLYCALGVIGLCAMWVGLVSADEWLSKALGGGATFVLLILGAYAVAIGGCLCSLGGAVLAVLSLLRGEGRPGLAVLGLLLSVSPVLLSIVILADVS